MSKPIRACLVFIAMLTAVYLGVAFTLWSLDPGQWDEKSRFLVAWAGGGIGIGFAFMSMGVD